MMSKRVLPSSIALAVEQDRPLEPLAQDGPLLDLPADLLRESVVKHQDSNGALLWLRKVRVLGELDLQALCFGIRLRFEECEFEDALQLRQARAKDIHLSECVLKKGFFAEQLATDWNLLFSESTIEGGINLLGSRIGGKLSLIGTRLEGEPGPVGPPGVIFNCEGAQIVGDMRCDELVSSSGIRLVGATIGGQLSLANAALKGGADNRKAPLPALNADRAEVAGDMFCDGLVSSGEIRLLQAKIGGQLSLKEGELDGKVSDNHPQLAFSADGFEVAGDMVCIELVAKGEVRMLQAKIGGQLILNDAKLETGRADDGSPSPAFDGDGFEVTGDMFCDGLVANGEIRMLQAKIGGQLTLNAARLSGASSKGQPLLAFCADAFEVAGGMFCYGLVCNGEMRLPGATILSVFVLKNATLNGWTGKNGGTRPALNGDRAHIAGSMLCEPINSNGEMRLRSTVIDGQLSLAGALFEGPIEHTSLCLHRSKIDELFLSFRGIEGGLDLRDASVQCLWDAGGGAFLGQLPKKLRLDGFRYESFREPLDADKRIDWVSRSQEENHYPDVYAQLAEAFRRVGNRGDARKVAIANERRARRDCSNPLRRIWHDIQWLTVGYGYRNWLAILWLSVIMFGGTVLFKIFESDFVETKKHAPAFEPILYAIDATFPILELSQSRLWTATAGMAWVELGLAVSGYALIAAVVAAAAGLFNRDQI
jgi:hypothetical protein